MQILRCSLVLYCFLSLFSLRIPSCLHMFIDFVEACQSSYILHAFKETLTLSTLVSLAAIWMNFGNLWRTKNAKMTTNLISDCNSNVEKMIFSKNNNDALMLFNKIIVRSICKIQHQKILFFEYNVSLRDLSYPHQ